MIDPSVQLYRVSVAAVILLTLQKSEDRVYIIAVQVSNQALLLYGLHCFFSPHLLDLLALISRLCGSEVGHSLV